MDILHLHQTKAWVLALALLLVMLVTWRVLYAVGVKAAVARGPRQLGMIQDAVGVLLALILAFEFNMANSRYDIREDLAVQEAGAIVNCYQRCDLVSQALRDRCQTLVREYAAISLHVYSLPDLRQLDSMVTRLDAIVRELWSAAIADMAGADVTAKHTFVLAGLNELGNTHGKRVASRSQFVPGSIILATLGLCVAWAAFAGYAYGLQANRQSWAWFAFAVTVALFVHVTLDLDRPWGLIRYERGRAAIRHATDMLGMRQAQTPPNSGP